MGTRVITDWTELIDRHRDGDREATARLVRAATPIIRRTVMPRIRHADVDDAVQEALLIVVRKVGTMRTPTRFPAWVRMVARRAAIDVGRRHARSVPTTEATLDRMRGHHTLDVDALATRLDAPRLSAQLGRLTTRERDVVMYFAANEDASYADAARQLRCPIGSLGPTRRRALEKLRQAPGVVA